MPRYNMESAFPPIAQLDRVSDSDSEGRGFESLWAGHQAEPGRTSRPVPGLFFYLAARGWGGICSVAAAH